MASAVPSDDALSTTVQVSRSASPLASSTESTQRSVSSRVSRVTTTTSTDGIAGVASVGDDPRGVTIVRVLLVVRFQSGENHAGRAPRQAREGSLGGADL